MSLDSLASGIVTLKRQRPGAARPGRHQSKSADLFNLGLALDKAIKHCERLPQSPMQRRLQDCVEQAI
jgi:hypothetical protein